MPIGVQNQGLGQGAIGRQKHGPHVPPVKNFAPAGSKLDRRLELSQKVVSVKVGAAVDKYTILGIKLVDCVASPVVIGEDFSPGGAVSQRFHRLLGKLLGLGCRLPS